MRGQKEQGTGQQAEQNSALFKKKSVRLYPFLGGIRPLPQHTAGLVLSSFTSAPTCQPRDTP